MAFVPSKLETSVTVGIDPKRYYDNDKGIISFYAGK